jgi:D-aminopeptidase
VRVSASEIGLRVGSFRCGVLNAITDVDGVQVGHATVTDPRDPSVQTGVTVVLPHGGNVFRRKVVAASHVINGFGKSLGLIQITELGVLESPIALTNTLSVPAVADGLLDHLLDMNPEIGATTGSVNVVVTECNDSLLNDLRGRHVNRIHVRMALERASAGAVEEGAIGAGRGMVAYSLKGGIGTSSRVLSSDSGDITVGVLVLSNFGHLRELSIAGFHVGAVLAADDRFHSAERSHGSIITVLATDAPISDRQLGRLLRRVQNGVARTGSSTATGSGEIVVGFTTANPVDHFATTSTPSIPLLRDDDQLIDALFAAVGDATEEAVLNSLFNATPVIGRDERTCARFPTERLNDLIREATAVTLEALSPEGPS